MKQLVIKQITDLENNDKFEENKWVGFEILVQRSFNPFEWDIKKNEAKQQDSKMYLHFFV